MTQLNKVVAPSGLPLGDKDWPRKLRVLADYLDAHDKKLVEETHLDLPGDEVQKDLRLLANLLLNLDDKLLKIIAKMACPIEALTCDEANQKYICKELWNELLSVRGMARAMIALKENSNE